MNTRKCLPIVLASLALNGAVHALTPPSASDGPVKLLTCTVSPSGILEAQVDSQADTAMSCAIRCNYTLGDSQFSRILDVRIPARFSGRVGGFNTSGAKAGDYAGEILGECKQESRG